MLCAVGLDVAARRDVVLQTWFGKEADSGREVVLQAETSADRPLPRGVKCCLVGNLQCTMQVIVCIERRIDGDFRRHAEATVEAPRFASVHIAEALHGDAEVMDGLLLVDGIAVGSHLEVGTETAVA